MIKKLSPKAITVNIRRLVCCTTLLLLITGQTLFAQSTDTTTLSRTAKGKVYLHFGIGVLPTGANLSLHFFLSNRISIAPDINVAMISATEQTKHTLYMPNGQPWYQGTKTEYRQDIGFQIGVRFNVHFKKNPKKFDPYFSFGAHYTNAPYNFRNVASGPSFGNTTYLQSTNNYFLPVSAAFGYRWHMKKISTFSEIGFGSYLVRFGLAFRIK